MSAEQTELINTDLVALDVNLGETKTEVIGNLAKMVEAAGRAEAAGLTADALDREGKAATGLPGGFAIPHCRSAAVSQGSLAFARLDPKVDFGAKDGPADLVFLIAAAEGGGADHMKLLTQLARALVRKDFLLQLREAKTKEEIVDMVNEVVKPPKAAVPAAAAAAAAAATASGKPTIVAVTACPTGIAHTFMAADSLVNTAKEMGYELFVEPQGSGKVETLAPSIIKNASAAIFATDVGVKEKGRFAGLPVIESGVKRAISEPKKMIEEALEAAKNPNARRVPADAGGASSSQGEGSQLSWGKRLQQALMTGVSYMIPFVAAGGLLIALGFLFGGYEIAGNAKAVLANNSLVPLVMPAGLAQYLGAVFFTVGAAGMGFLVPALSGYIAYALAGRPGIAPGFIGGAVSIALNAGFLGGLVTGLLAGFVAAWLAGMKAPRWLAGLMPVVIIPLVTSLITGGLMYFLLGKPIAALMDAMTKGLTGMAQGGSVIVLGVILGLMMCFDLGGPVNKAAYLFATAGLGNAVASGPANQAPYLIMAAVMAAGMVPPIALAAATTFRPKLFTEVERENGRAAWLLGASFISEGAIPFAAADPLRVIPSMMVGGAVTGALTMAFSVGSRAPHGGIFVFFAIDPFWGFALSILVGAAISAVAVIIAKSIGNKAPVEVAA